MWEIPNAILAYEPWATAAHLLSNWRQDTSALLTLSDAFQLIIQTPLWRLILTGLAYSSGRLL